MPDGVRPASVHVVRGLIGRVDAYDAFPAEAGVEVSDAGDLVLMPGLVDTHVHVNEPGRTEWEGFATATRAAAAGGVTTIVDMPLNASPPTTTAGGVRGEGLVDGRQAPRRRRPDRRRRAGQRARAARRWSTPGVSPSSASWSHSGVDDFPDVDEEVLRAAMPVLADAGVPLLVHAELAGPIDAALARQGNLSDAELRRYVHWLESRPRQAENEAVDLIVRLSRPTGARAHVVHLSSADAVVLLRDARDAGVAVSAETCPHYLTLAAEDVPDGATEYKCAPPIRERHNRERLWQALADGIVDAGRDGPLAFARDRSSASTRATSRGRGVASRRSSWASA